LEPSRTQLVTQSEYFGGSDWVSSSNVNITDNVTTSPEGVQNAALINFTSGSNYFQNGGAGMVSGSTYTISCYVKRALSTDQVFRLYGNGNIVSGNFTATSEWQRFTYTFTAASTNFSCGLTTPSTCQIHLYGFQVEQASYPTSYIPNHSGGGSVTRGADGMNNSSLGLTDCTFFVDFVPLSSVMGLLDFYDNSNARIFYIAINSVKYLQFNSVQGGTIGDVLGPLTIGNRYKLAFTLNASNGDITIFINGTKYNTYSTTISSLNKILQVSSFGYYNNTEFNQILTFGEILSDADCITLTTV
jgi:hypothetical protein